jgi:AcrR family transcriptional regulator
MTDSAEALLARVMLAPDADATETRILDAAQEVLEEFGLRRITMDVVAGRAGLHRATLYRRFDNKDALVEAVFVRELKRFLMQFTAAMARIEDVEEQIAEAFVLTRSYMREHRLFQRLLQLERDVLMGYFTVGRGAMPLAIQFLAMQLRTAPGVARGVAADAEAAAETLMRLVVSFVLDPESAIPLDDEAQARAYAHRYLAPLVTGRLPA